MYRAISRSCWLGLLGLAWLGLTSEGQAQVKVSNVRVNFHIEVSSTPKGPRPGAPWYAYFPADPRLMPAPQLSPFPTWPMPYPPQTAPKEQPKQSLVPAGPAGPMLTQNWPGNPALQPVGFVPAQAPSYWYQGR